MKSKYSKVQNFFPYVVMPDIKQSDMHRTQYQSIIHKEHGGSLDPSKNLDLSLTPVNKPRIIQDVLMWRESIRQAEDQLIPFRYMMQAAYKDTILELHTRSCFETREKLSLRRKFELLDGDNNDVNDEKWQEYFSKPWFKKWMLYAIRARWYGYSLISMGDIIDGEFRNIVLIPREHVSPDRHVVANIPTNLTGEDFLFGFAEDGTPWSHSHMWIDTPDEHGLSSCGYGMLYEITFYAIGLKNNISYNIQFCEVFGMPYRQLKTNKTDPQNLQQLKQSLDQMGSMGAILTTKDDEIVFFDSGKGKGYESYGNLHETLADLVTQMVFGHADALRSTPGKLGGQQGGDLSPQQQAINNTKDDDGEFLMDAINGKLIPFMRLNGINVPENLRFQFKNDDEEAEAERVRNTENKTISEMVANMAKGGIHIEITPDLQAKMKLKLKEAPVPTPIGGTEKNNI